MPFFMRWCQCGYGEVTIETFHPTSDGMEMAQQIMDLFHWTEIDLDEVLPMASQIYYEKGWLKNSDNFQSRSEE
jgi:hypothetical protein